MVSLFIKHPELVTNHKNSEITEIVSIASTKNLVANLVKKAYTTVKIAISTSTEFAAKKAQFLAQQ